MKKLLVFFVFMVSVATYATGVSELTEQEKARTASYVFKFELFLGCKEPFSLQNHPPKDRILFFEKWVQEDIDGMGNSEAAKLQKKRMTSLLNDIISLPNKDNRLAKWKNKDVEEIAQEITSDLRCIAQAAGITLTTDKQTSNQAVDSTKKARKIAN